jgi:hypothetical protein
LVAIQDNLHCCGFGSKSAWIRFDLVVLAFHFSIFETGFPNDQGYGFSGGAGGLSMDTGDQFGNTEFVT